MRAESAESDQRDYSSNGRNERVYEPRSDISRFSPSPRSSIVVAAPFIQWPRGLLLTQLTHVTCRAFHLTFAFRRTVSSRLGRPQKNRRAARFACAKRVPSARSISGPLISRCRVIRRARECTRRQLDSSIHRSAEIARIRDDGRRNPRAR